MVTTIDSEPSCNIVETRMNLATLTLWNGAVDEVAQNLANCIQKTFNYFVGVSPVDGSRPARFRSQDPVHNFHWSVFANVSLRQSCTVPLAA